MKGLGILAILAALIGIAMFALSRPSDADLERLEGEIAGHLEAGNELLTEATRELGPLRAIKPNIGRLDDDLSQLRAQQSDHLAALDVFRDERPEDRTQRSRLISARQEARDQAMAWRSAAADLVARVTVIDDFTRETQPQVQLMLTYVGEMNAQRMRAINAGRTVDERIQQKIEKLQQNVLEVQTLARRVYEFGAEDANQGQTIALTVKNEVEQLLGDMKAVIKELGEG